MLLFPAQLAMYDLIGFSPAGDADRRPTTDIPFDQRMNIIQKGRRELCDITGYDYGYNVQAWHTALLNGMYYTWDYPSTDHIDEEVKKCTNDVVRKAIVAQLEAEESTL